MSHTSQFFNHVKTTAENIDTHRIDRMAALLGETRASGGRVFVIGVGGSAGNAGHMVNDLRKLCDIETYAPTDNVAELTARINDDGWDGAFVGWLKTSRLSSKDTLFVLSVGGGNAEKNVSMNIVNAIKYAQNVTGSKVLGIVGKNDGYAAMYGDCVLVIPQTDPNLVTPISEAFQAVVWHSLVSNPTLQKIATKW